MYIHDQRKPLTCNFSELQPGDLFGWEEDGDLFYLMVIEENIDDDDNDAENYGKAVVLGSNCNSPTEGCVWTFKSDDEVQPLKGDLKVWAR